MTSNQTWFERQEIPFSPCGFQNGMCINIEDIKYSQEGHLNQNQVEQWVDDILKDANTDPRLWQKDEEKIEYDRWGRLITDGWGNDFSSDY
jgi:hypothetical protein